MLLRYVNAGNQYHSMAVLGAHQTVIALDGSPLDFSRRYVAETFGPGQTADAIVTVPAATTAANRLAIYDGSLLLHNSNTAGFGGMLTFLTVGGHRWRHRHHRPGDQQRRLRGRHPDRHGRRHHHRRGDNVTAAEYFLDSTACPRHDAGNADERHLRLRERERHGFGDRPLRSAHPLRARPGLARQLGRLQLGAGQRRRRHRPDHDVPDADPQSHQRHGYGGRRRARHR